MADSDLVQITNDGVHAATVSMLAFTTIWEAKGYWILVGSLSEEAVVTPIGASLWVAESDADFPVPYVDATTEFIFWMLGGRVKHLDRRPFEIIWDLQILNDTAATNTKVRLWRDNVKIDEVIVQAQSTIDASSRRHGVKEYLEPGEYVYYLSFLRSAAGNSTIKGSASTSLLEAIQR